MRRQLSSRDYVLRTCVDLNRFLEGKRFMYEWNWRIFFLFYIQALRTERIFMYLSSRDNAVSVGY